MRLSQLNIKKMNLKNVDQHYSGQDILMKLGELYQYESGIYGYGHIWTKLQRIIENIIIDELDKADCIHVEFPKLQPRKVWDQSNRWELYTQDPETMFTLRCRFGEYGLAPTAEECAAIFAANRLLSYKNLPATYYQIGDKFRQEIRTRGYLFRPRTFMMMDAYSFDKSKSDMELTYQKMHDVYLRIFQRLGIHIIPTTSDNGTMGGKISEEFQVITELGEDVILYDEQRQIGINKDVLSFDNKDDYLQQFGIEDVSQLKEYHCLELGNNFQLGTFYSDQMSLFYKDKNQQNQPYYMGCYGIGLGRIVAIILENSVLKDNDQVKGISLPAHLAPYKIQIVYHDQKKDMAEKLYKDLKELGINSIIDDRQDISFGSRIKDVYVLGTPYMAILGKQSDETYIEIEETKTGRKFSMTFDELVHQIRK